MFYVFACEIAYLSSVCTNISSWFFKSSEEEDYQSLIISNKIKEYETTKQ